MRGIDGHVQSANTLERPSAKIVLHCVSVAVSLYLLPSPPSFLPSSLSRFLSRLLEENSLWAVRTLVRLVLGLHFRGQDAGRGVELRGSISRCAHRRREDVGS